MGSPPSSAIDTLRPGLVTVPAATIDRGVAILAGSIKEETKR
jgi:hypothetical protein